jgi:hypothetical protein
MSLLKSAAVAMSCLVAGVAQAETLECTVDANAGSGGYVTKTYVFDYDGATGKAIAADGWIQEMTGGPMDVKLSENTAKKAVFTWTLNFTNGSGQQTKMLYRAAYFKGDKAITVRATPSGYANSFEGRGTCKTIR